MSRWPAIALCLLLAGCGGPLSFLTGGGPNVAANVQAGKTNTQTLGQTNVTEQKITKPTAERIVQSADTPKVKAEEVRTVVINEVPAWLVVLAFIGWLLPTPGQIADSIRRMFSTLLWGR